MKLQGDNYPTNQGVFVGSYATVAALLDELAEIPGLRGVMLTFDDFVIGMEQFGSRIQPLMKSRQHVLAAA
jgi:pyrimidine oxygenase